jgi:hypothetical protein
MQRLLCGFSPLVNAGLGEDLVDSAIVAADDKGLIDLLVSRTDDGVWFDLAVKGVVLVQKFAAGAGCTASQLFATPPNAEAVECDVQCPTVDSNSGTHLVTVDANRSASESCASPWIMVWVGVMDF